MNTTDFFLTSLFSGKPEDFTILIWTTPSKYSYWHSTTQAAAETAANLDRENVYFGCATAPSIDGLNDLLPSYQEQARIKKQRVPENISQIRCHAEDTTGIPGVWADIDIAGPNHKKTNLPADLDQIYEILRMIELKPSFVLHTGGGIQAWWLFDKFLVFEDDYHRAGVGQLVQMWQEWCKKQVYDAGITITGNPFDMDSTHDLARVFRLPGTYNQKSSPAQQVKIISDPLTVMRYGASFLREWLEFKGVQPPVVRPVKIQNAGPVLSTSNYTIDFAASPDPDNFMTLLENDKKFRGSWQHKRPDIADKSDSSFDMSLASIAFAYGWSDQEIINLMIYHRRHRQSDMKHPGYYDLTLAKAKILKGQVETAQAAHSQAVKEIEQSDQQPPGKGEEDVLKWVSDLFGVPVTRWVKYLTDPPSYVIEIAGNQVAVGNASAVQQQNAVRSAVYSACDISIPKFKPARWAEIITKLGTVKEEIDPDPTETLQGLVHYYLKRYFNEKATAETLEEALAKDQPFRGKKGYFFVLAKLKEFMSDHRVNPGVGFSKALRDQGCTLVTKGVLGGNGWTTKAIWQVPSYMIREIEQESQQDGKSDDTTAGQ